MDSNFWASRLAAAKRQFTTQQHHLQTSQLDRLNIDDLEIEEEMSVEVPCPYCYEDFDVVSLCSHLEDEHSCESKVAVCPICSVKVSTDLLSHITLQHGQLFKLQRHQRLRKLLAMPNSQALSFLGRDLREAHLQVLLEGIGGGGGGGAYKSSNSSSNAAAAAVDPLLSSMFLNISGLPEAEDNSKSLLISKPHEEKPRIEKKKKLPNIWKSRFDSSSSLSIEEREKRMKQAAGRAGFLQDLLVSTLMSD